MRVYPTAIYSIAAILATVNINDEAIANPVIDKFQQSIEQDTKNKNIATELSKLTENLQADISQPEFSSNTVFSDSGNIEKQTNKKQTNLKSSSVTIRNETQLISLLKASSRVRSRVHSKYPSKSLPIELKTPEKLYPDNIPEQKISQQISQTLPDPNAPTEIPDFPPPEETPPITEEEVQDELGEIEIIQPKVKQPPRRKQPNGQLLLRSSAFTSSNITSLDNFRDGDTVFVNSATFLVTPKLGDQTRLIATVGGGLARFATERDSNYNFLNFGLGVQQRIGKGMYAQFGWAQDRIYRDDDGDRLLLDDSLRLIIGRQDQLDDKLRLDSFYELRGSFTNPDEQSRIVNSLGTRLRYDISPKLQGSLNYRLSLQDFTEQSRFDTRHQLGIQAVYSINQDLFIGSSASYLFGSSSGSNIDLDNFSVGINIGLNVPLF